MADQPAWPFLIGRSKTQDYRFVVIPEFMSDSSLEVALLTGTGGDPGPPGTALVREIGPPGQRVTVVYQVRLARAEHVGLPGDGLLSDAHGRSILLTEGLALRGPAAPVLASRLTRQALEQVHVLVRPAFERFWAEERGFIRQPGQPFPLPSADPPRDLLELRAADPAAGTGPVPGGSEPAGSAPASSVPARSARGVRNIGAAAGPWAAPDAGRPDRDRGSAGIMVIAVALAAIIVVGLGLLLTSLLRGHTASPGSAAQTMTTLCRDLEADQPAAAYALTASSYRAKVTKARFASTVLPRGSPAATCTYQSRTSGASSASGVMTVTQRGTPTALSVTLTENSAKQWQVTKISGQ